MTNNGIISLRNARHDGQATIIVSGLARSGTSMVAHILEALGVPMGESAAGRHDGEDQEFATAFREGWPDLKLRLIAARNEAHEVWGFKLPDIQDHTFAREIFHFRWPRLVFITRDMTATCQRKLLSESWPDALEAMSRVALDQVALVRFLCALQCPVLMLSYEKVMLSPASAVAVLAAFSGMKPSQDAIDRIAAAVVGNNEAYLRAVNQDI